MSDPTPLMTGPPLPDAPPPPEAAGKKRSSPLRSAIEWVVIICLALIGALVIRTVLLQPFYIPSASMEPTLQVHDRILVNKVSYDMHGVHRGDIVVFKRSALRGITGQINDLVKRVVGLPGETIAATPDGEVEINGQVLKESYLPRGTITTNLPETKIPPGHYFVMGDNPGSLIVGRAFVVIWPVNRLGGL
jgi:signal peptidase I